MSSSLVDAQQLSERWPTMKLKVLPQQSFPYVCILCGNKFEYEELLEVHLNKEHDTSIAQLKGIAISTTGQQGPFKK